MSVVPIASDSSVHYAIFTDPQFLKSVYQDTMDEVDFQEMQINGHVLCRPGAFQATITKDGVYPLLRCPSAEGLIVKQFTPTILRIRDRLSEHFGINLNHVKIQIYKDKDSFIRPHSDKTIDLEPNTPIINYRIGSTRLFSLVNKDDNKRICVPMHHSSVFVLGPKDNKEWQHYVDPITDSIEDLVGPSISMVFRCVGTFVKPTVTSFGLYFTRGLIYGQGARYKTERAIKTLQMLGYVFTDVWSPEKLNKEMIKIFGRENRDSSFDYSEYDDIRKNTFSIQ